MVVRSKRRVLILQALLLVALASSLGWAVETWRLLPMTRLSARTGVPVALMFFAAVGVVVAATSIKDRWGHQIAFEPDHLRIRDWLGMIRVRYDEIAEAKALPGHGVGIKLRDGAAWLDNFEGSPSSKRKKMDLSAITQRFYGCEIDFPSKTLDIGVGPFLEEINGRIRAAGRGDLA